MSEHETRIEDAGVRYPFVSLEKALGRAKQLYDSAGDHDMLVEDAFDIWGYSIKSSGGHQTIGALNMYGLIRGAGAKEQRKLALTVDALTYFRDEREEVHSKLRAAFAVKPRLIAALWKQWGDNPPADNIARSHLKIDRKLTDQAARAFLGIYKENLAYADLKGSGKAIEESEGDDSGYTPPPPLLNEKPKVEVLAGERELTTGLLSKNSSFRLIVSGKVGEKEIERLIKKLELDKEILSDPEDEKPAN